jgi:hypothetical protein
MPGGSATAAEEITSADGDQRVLAVLDQFLQAHRDDALAWVACGPLWAEYRNHAGTDGGGEPASFLQSLSGVAKVRSRYAISGDAIVAASTKNQQRAVAAILTAPAEAAHAARRPLLGPVAPLVRLAAAARERAEELGEALLRADVAFPGGTANVRGLFLSAALHLAYSRRLVERGSPSVVVVASNHDAVARALARAARERDVPSVLVPHAPMLGDIRLRDAPTDYVAVRGERDASWYLANGAEPDQVAVVGNPALQPAPQVVPIPTGAPVVFAPSPYADDVIADQVALVAAANVGDVVVTPHPRQRLDFLQRIAPDSWTFHSGRTYERLQKGATAVVQSSSGVALESLLLGIPVLEIEPAEGRLYPFLQSDLVPSVRTAEELAEQLALVRSRVGDRAYRESLAEYARSWCAAGGEEAAQNTRHLVQLAAAGGKRSRLTHDAWQPSDGEGS